MPRARRARHLPSQPWAQPELELGAVPADPGAGDAGLARDASTAHRQQPPPDQAEEDRAETGGRSEHSHERDADSGDVGAAEPGDAAESAADRHDGSSHGCHCAPGDGSLPRSCASFSLSDAAATTPTATAATPATTTTTATATAATATAAAHAAAASGGACPAADATVDGRAGGPAGITSHLLLELLNLKALS